MSDPSFLAFTYLLYLWKFLCWQKVFNLTNHLSCRILSVHFHLYFSFVLHVFSLFLQYLLDYYRPLQFILPTISIGLLRISRNCCTECQNANFGLWVSFSHGPCSINRSMTKSLSIFAVTDIIHSFIPS